MNDPASTAPAEQPISSGEPIGTLAYIEGGDIWLLDLGSGDTRRLTTDGQHSAPAWSPDGLWLASATLRDGQSQIDLVRADGSERVAATQGPAQFSDPAFSRDGALYVIRRQPGDTPPIEVVRRDAAGVETVVHQEPGGLCSPIGLSVAVDQRVALSLDCGRGSYTLIVTPASSATLDVAQQIGAGVCAAPGVWAQQDRRLAVITAPECDYQAETGITVLDDVGGTPQVTRILRSSGIGTLDWSPDGQWLVYDRPDGLWVVESNQGEPRRLRPSGTQPAWRPATP